MNLFAGFMLKSSIAQLSYSCTCEGWCWLNAVGSNLAKRLLSLWFASETMQENSPHVSDSISHHWLFFPCNVHPSQYEEHITVELPQLWVLLPLELTCLKFAVYSGCASWNFKPKFCSLHCEHLYTQIFIFSHYFSNYYLINKASVTD